MRKIIYKIWQALRSWIQKQERFYEEDYIRGICKKFHRVYPECKFKCYYPVLDKNTFVLHLDSKYATLRSALEFLDEEQMKLSFTILLIIFINILVIIVEKDCIGQLNLDYVRNA